MSTALSNVAPVFLIMALGYALRAIGFLKEETAAAFSRLVFYVAAPALLMRSIAATPFSSSFHLPTVGVMAGASVAIALATYLALRGTAPARHGVMAQGAHRSNMVFFGLPVVASALGEDAVGGVAVLIGLTVIVYNLLAVLLLSLPHQDVSAGSLVVWRRTLRQIAVNPLILGVVAGIILAVTGTTLPRIVDEPLEMVARTALPLALFALGAGLDMGRLRAEMIPALAVSALKLIVYPLLVWWGLRELGLTGAALQGPVLIAASPTAVVSYIMACEMGGDERLAGAIVIGSTLMSVVTIVGWLLFFK